MLRHAISFIFAIACLASSAAAMAGVWDRHDGKSLDWFRSEEAREIARNVLAWQTERGDWPNDVDSSEPHDPTRDRERGSFDDGHTTGDIRFLARMHHATGREEYREAALQAIDLILESQYAHGGFPQRAEPGNGYQRYITFNDQAMVDILELLRDVAAVDELAFVGADRRDAAEAAFERGIECIIECQVVIDGQRTIWAAQHDERTFAPRPARSFEPASLATAESAGVLRLLMSLDDPSHEVVDAVNHGARWFQDHRIEELRLVRDKGDAWIESDPDAPPLWARFYSLETDRPIFAGRDGVVRDSLAEIERERRRGYAWYGRWGARVLEQYQEWPYRESPDGTRE